jgi:hypothetical protein
VIVALFLISKVSPDAHVIGQNAIDVKLADSDVAFATHVIPSNQ